MKNDLFGFAVDPDAAPGFREWVFCPGMLFQATGKWWGKRGDRDRPHEGIDLLLYRDQGGDIRHIDESFPIPMLADGRIVGIMDDFLGKSIIVEHPPEEGSNGNILTMYGHTHLMDHLRTGAVMKKGAVLATIAGREGRSFTMSPHLHITMARTLAPVSYNQLSWDVVGSLPLLELLDPLDFIQAPFSIADSHSPACRNASPMP